MFVWITTSAVTGVLYRWSRDMFGVEKANAKWLLIIHQV
jgi:hypothetical protein